MATIIPFQLFKKEVFSKLNIKEKNRLFYISLFDPSGWEGILFSIKYKFPDLEEIKREVLNNFKLWMSQSNHKKYIRNKEERFIQNNVYSDILLKHLLMVELKDNKFQLNTKDKFPDIKVYHKEEKIGIELKGLLSFVSIKDRIKDEVIDSILKGKMECDKLLLVMCVPIPENESPYRVTQLIDVLYVLEEYISSRTKKECKLICQCFTPKYEENFSIENLAERIRKATENKLSIS